MLLATLLLHDARRRALLGGGRRRSGADRRCCAPGLAPRWGPWSRDHQLGGMAPLLPPSSCCSRAAGGLPGARWRAAVATAQRCCGAWRPLARAGAHKYLLLYLLAAPGVLAHPPAVCLLLDAGGSHVSRAPTILLLSPLNVDGKRQGWGSGGRLGGRGQPAAAGFFLARFIFLRPWASRRAGTVAEAALMPLRPDATVGGRWQASCATGIGRVRRGDLVRLACKRRAAGYPTQAGALLLRRLASSSACITACPRSRSGLQRCLGRSPRMVKAASQNPMGCTPTLISRSLWPYTSACSRRQDKAGTAHAYLTTLTTTGASFLLQLQSKQRKQVEFQWGPATARAVTEMLTRQLKLEITNAWGRKRLCCAEGAS